jgi:hypothetical protein
VRFRRRSRPITGKRLETDRGDRGQALSARQVRDFAAYERIFDTEQKKHPSKDNP